jgi:hypothetical protein
MAESLDVVKRKRNVAKSRLEHAARYFLDFETEHNNLVEVQVKKQHFDENKALFYEVQYILVSNCHDDDLEVEIELLISMDEKVNTVETRWIELMKRFNINVIQVVNEPLVENSTVKLPDIRLPTFSGKFDDWLDFKNSFTALIVDDESLSDTHKLQYLRSCLKDEAINVQSEDETFQSLWTALKNMYENKRYIINKHIEDLLTIKSMAKGSSIDLRNILNQAKKHYRALSSFDYDINQLTEVFIIHLITIAV